METVGAIRARRVRAALRSTHWRVAFAVAIVAGAGLGAEPRQHRPLGVGHERADAVAAAALAEGATRAAVALVLANLTTTPGDDRSSRAALLVHVAAQARERALEMT